METWTDIVNLYPLHNVATAFDINLAVPEIKYLNKITEELKPIDWNIYPSKNIAIKKIPGVPLTVTAWYDGEFSNHVLSIHDRFVGSGQQGYQLSENCITMFKGINPLKKQFSNIAYEIQERQEEFRGLVSIEAILFEGKIYYNHISFGKSLDFIFCMAEFFGVAVDELIEKLSKRFELSPGFLYAASMRLYSYPFSINNNFRIVEDAGIQTYKGQESYVLTSTGKRIDRTWKNLYNQCKGLNKHGICYRTDGDIYARRIFHVLKKCQYI